MYFKNEAKIRLLIYDDIVELIYSIHYDEARKLLEELEKVEKDTLIAILTTDMSEKGFILRILDRKTYK